ncbi:MAG: HEAT repeat protein [Planctomycetota bacterium]|jgi:HEAT repeat protein
MTDPTKLDTPALLIHTSQLALADPTGDDETRWDAVRELHRRGGAVAFDQAASWSNDEQPLLRALAADVLSQLGWDEDHPHAQASEPILTAMLEDEALPVVSAALMAMGHLGVGSVAQVCSMAGHREEDIRYSVAYCLGNREDEQSRATLVDLSKDEDHEVRDWATYGLGTLCDTDSPAIRDALAARLNDDDEDTRCEAMVGLANRKDTRATEAVRNELQNECVGRLAIEAAGVLRDPQFTERLLALQASNPDDTDLAEAIQKSQASEG